MLDMLLKMSLNVIVLIDVKFVIMTQINDVQANGKRVTKNVSSQSILDVL